MHSAAKSALVRSFGLSRKVARGLFEHHAFDHAATMAFYFFLGLIPLVMGAGLLAGNLVQRREAEELVAPLYRAMPAVAAELLRAEVRRVASASVGTVAPISLLGFAWLTTNGVHNLMDVFELLVHARPRPWWQQRLFAVAWLAGLVVVMTFATWLLIVLGGMATGVGDALAHLPSFLHKTSELLGEGWERASVLVAFGSISCAGLAVFYRLAVGHPSTVRRRVWPGTLIAHVLWIAVSWVFGEYVRTMAHYAVFYGSLATVAVALLWLYLTSLALLTGAEVNAQLEQEADRHGPFGIPARTSDATY